MAGLGFLGEFLPITDHRPMFDSLQLPDDIFFLSVPIIIQKRPVAAILVWDNQHTLETARSEIEVIASKIALALQMLLFRSKILLS